MPLGQFGTPPSADISTKDLADLVARLIKEVTYLLNGGLDTLNVNELSADVINAGTLNAALVTVKAALTGAAYILINAAQGLIINDGTKNTFQADINGMVTMVGALIQSATGYPRVELNSTTNLLKAMADATHYLTINPVYSASTPSVSFQDPGTHADLYLAGDVNETFVINNQSGNTQVGAQNGDLSLVCGASKQVKVPAWSQVYSTGNGQTLQQALDGKLNANGASGIVYVATTPGGPANTAIVFTNGARTQ